MPIEIKKRLTGGLIISLLVHAFILSLQFGLPGLGLPELEAPWNKRRAATPEISIQIANSTPAATPAVESSTAISTNSANPASESAANPVPVLPLNTAATATATPAAAATERTESKPAVAGIRLVAPQKAAPVPVPAVTKAASKPRAAKKFNTDATPPLAQKRKMQATDVPRVIAQDKVRDDNFVMAVPDPDELPKKAEAEAELKKQNDEMTQAGVEEEIEQAKAAKAAEQNQKRKKREELMRKQTEELAQQKTADNTAQREQLAKQLDEDNRKQADEATRRSAAALALQKQLEAEEQNRRAQQEAAKAEESKLAEQKRQDDNKRQDEQRQQIQLTQAAQAQKEQKEQQQREQQVKEQQLALEAEKRKQEEQRQQAAAVARQKQQEEQLAKARTEELLARQKSEELAAKQKADEQAARQRAEQTAAEQKEREATQLAKANAAAAAAAAANAAANKTNAANAANSASNIASNTGANSPLSAGPNASSNGSNPGGNTAQGDKGSSFVLPKSILGSDLANRAREQARGLDLLRGTPPAPRADAEEKPRRRSVFGGLDKDVPVRLYIDSWKQKIERNGNLNYSQLSKDRARGDPVVTVSIRSDGSVEDITINRSSGRADIDEAVRRIIRLNAKYAAFPPNIAAQYDVIEIRRIWNFEENLRIIEELR